VRDALCYRPFNNLEPTVVLTAIAAATSRIGLIGMLSSTFNDPYDVARRLATLDLISVGRAGWRNARTLASHNPATYRERQLGDFVLNGKAPVFLTVEGQHRLRDGRGAMTGFHLNLSRMTPGHFRHAWRLPHTTRWRTSTSTTSSASPGSPRRRRSTRSSSARRGAPSSCRRGTRPAAPTASP
jgi:hypothetical protein